jgi:serine/threonine protein kinase/tetratricopeptide (TPR) repeat protein
MASLLGQTVSHYRIIEKLDEGGMGVVYRAEDTRLKRAVALKFLPPSFSSDTEAKERFVQEAQAASSLQHHNICTIHDIGESEDGQMFIVMDLYDGETLKKRIERGPVDIRTALDIVTQVAGGLTSAHGNGILHRDIKPANILMTRDGTAKIVDFGLAKLSSGTMLTKAGTTMGTLAYMSPEQVRGLPVDRRTDIWSLGVVLYEMLTGQLPFRGEYEPAIMYSILEETPAPIADLRPDIPAALIGVLDKMLAKDPGQRYGDTESLVADIRLLSKGETPQTTEHQRRPTKSRRAVLVGGSVLLAGLIIGLLMLKPWSVRGPAIQTLAVLPLHSASNAQEAQAFAENMTEELITQLSKVRALTVRSRTSAMKYKSTDKSLTEIARELNVDALVEGNTMVSGDRVRISVRLLKADPEQHLWAEDYTENMKDVISLQSQVAQAIVREIKIVVTPEEQARLTRRQSVNVDAYTAYVMGRYYWNQWSAEGFQKGLQFFREAMSKDSSFAPAYAGVADVYSTLWYMGLAPFKEVEPFWRPAAQKAVALDDNLAEAYVSLAATSLVYDWDWEGAEKELRRAIELNPGYATGHHWYALLLSARGRHAEAINEIERAQQLDSTNAITNASAGWVNVHARRYDEAVAQFRRTLLLDSLSAPAHSGLGEVYELQGKNEEALGEYLRVTALTGASFATLKAGTAQSVSRLRAAYAAAGWQGYWKEQLVQLQGLAQHSYVSSYHLGSLCARLARTDDAFAWLEKAYHDRSTYLMFANVDPNIENLKSDPRFSTLLKKIKLAE